MKIFAAVFVVFWGLCFALPALAFEVGVARFELRDAVRDKDLPVRVSYPVGVVQHGGWPVVIFSHGAYGSREGYDALVGYWAAAGYVVVQATHEDSVSLGNRFGSRLVFRFWDTRPLDVSFLIDELGAIEAQLEGLEGGVNRGRIGVVGHSFGGQTAELIAGAVTYARPRQPRSFGDNRVAAVIVISPSGTSRLLREESFAEMRLPMLFITGDNDTTTLTDITPEQRIEVFDYSAEGDKYLLWVNGANHNFGGISGATYRGAGASNAVHVEILQAMTVGFWDVYLRQRRDVRDFTPSAILPERLAREVDFSRR